MITFRAIHKSFGGVSVLKNVSFALQPGRTLGLVGENGAGKSTLMNILGGNLPQDSGDMLLHGQPYVPRSSREAAHQGIAFIHQELNLFPNLSIAENLWLTNFPRRAGVLISRTEIHRRTSTLLQQVGLHARPDLPVEGLSAGERQLVEVAKALSMDARLIIFDEPTTSLTERECELLFNLIRQIQKRGLSIIYISHNLGEIFRLCDDVVVLRDGAVAGGGPVADFDVDRLISLMVGRSLCGMFPPRSGKPGADVTLEARRLTQPGIIRNISFQLHRGEILGIAGLMGAGRSELARILFGLDPCKSGEILMNGSPMNRASPRKRIHAGLAFLTESRREDGLCMEASIAENISLVSLPRQSRGPAKLVDLARLRASVQSIRQAVRLNPSAKLEQPVKTLSGGNQQKVVLAKWLLASPGILLLDEPTRGIDVGAKYEIYQLIIDLAQKGAAILVISSELEELLGICDRILVMNHGEIRDELRRAEFDRERILRGALHTPRLTA